MSDEGFFRLPESEIKKALKLSTADKRHPSEEFWNFMSTALFHMWVNPDLSVLREMLHDPEFIDGLWNKLGMFIKLTDGKERLIQDIFEVLHELHPRLVSERMLEGRYLVFSEEAAKIAEGGYGKIQVAWDTKMRRAVALKSSKIGDPQETKKYSLHREAKVTAQVSHPAVIRVFDIFNHDGHSYMVLEYLNPGEYPNNYTDLERLIVNMAVKGEYLQVGNVLRILWQLEDGMRAIRNSYFGRKQIIHRDYKPANAMDNGSQAKWLDFSGATGVLNNDKNRIIGTPLYWTPENCTNDPFTEESDVYSILLLSHELYANFPLHNETFDSYQLYGALLGKWTFVDLEQLRIKKELKTAVYKRLPKDLANKYANANEFFIQNEYYDKQLQKLLHLYEVGLRVSNAVSITSTEFLLEQFESIIKVFPTEAR